MSFSGTVVCFTGLSYEVRSEKGQLVEAMNGKLSADFNSSVTHLVSDRCDPRSEKYKAARHLKVPVMSVEWIDEAYKANQALNHLKMTLPALLERYKCPLFSKCVITVTGQGAEDRANLGRLVEIHGGVYEGQMSRKHCTHLIAASNSGEKYRKALEWGSIHIVSDKWLRHSIKQGYRLAEEKYRVVPTSAKREGGAGGATVANEEFKPSIQNLASASAPAVKNGGSCAKKGGGANRKRVQ